MCLSRCSFQYDLNSAGMNMDINKLLYLSKCCVILFLSASLSTDAITAGNATVSNITVTISSDTINTTAQEKTTEPTSDVVTESSSGSSTSGVSSDVTTATIPPTISTSEATLNSTSSLPDLDNTTSTTVIPTTTDEDPNEDKATISPGGTERTPTNTTTQVKHSDKQGISVRIYIYYGVIPGAAVIVFIFILLLVLIKRRKRRNASEPVEDPPDGKEEVIKKTDSTPRYSKLVITSAEQAGNGCIVIDNSVEDNQEQQDDYDEVGPDSNSDEKTSNRNSEKDNCDEVNKDVHKVTDVEAESDDQDDYATVDDDTTEPGNTNTDTTEGDDDYDVVDKDILENSIANVSNDPMHKNDENDDDDDDYNTLSFQSETPIKNTNSPANSSSAETENSKAHPCTNRDTENLDSPGCQIKKKDSDVCLTNTDEVHSGELLSSTPTVERPKGSDDPCSIDNDDDGLYDRTQQNTTQYRKTEVGDKCISPRSEGDTVDDVYNHLSHNAKPNSFTDGDEQRLSNEYSHITFNAKHIKQSGGASDLSYSHVAYDPRKRSFRVLDQDKDNDDTYDMSGFTPKAKTGARAGDYSHVVNLRTDASKQTSGNYDTMEFTIPDNIKHGNDYSCVVKTG